MIDFFGANLGRFRLRAFLVFLAGILDGVAVFMIPVVFAQMVKAGGEVSTYWNYFWLGLGCYVSSLALQWVIRKYGESLAGQLVGQTRYNLFVKLKRMSIGSLNKTHSGYLFSLMNKLSDGMQNITFDICWSFSKILSNLTLFFCFTYLESPWLAVLNLVLLTIFVIVSVVLSQKMAVLSKEMNTKRAALMETYADLMTNIATVKKLSIFDFAEEKILARTQQNYLQIDKVQSYHAKRWLILHSLFGMAFLGTIAGLIYLISIGQATVAVFVLYITAFQLVKGNVERLSESYKLLVENKAYLENLNNVVIEDEKYIPGKYQLWKSFKFEKVVFKHGGTNKQIKIPKFEINKGEIVAIVGKSGQGKSTFLNLLMNFIEPDQGLLMIDDMPFSKVPSSFWNKKVALVNQEIELFNLSLRENLILNKKNISDKKLMNYLQDVDLLEWCNGLKDGLNTMIGEKGLRLSAGQKQRVNLLRGLLLDREIIILDEPTSHLDNKTEKLVVSFLKKHLKNKTVIIVTHRPEILKMADYTYRIEKHLMLKQ